jgi:hypothetical protein
MKSPPIWSQADLERDLQRAIQTFRNERLQEPVEMYLREFDAFLSVVAALLERTSDLLAFEQEAVEVLADPKLALAARYLTGPMISEDDLKTLASAVLTPARIKADGAMVGRIVEVLQTGLDRRRFCWVGERRQPTEAERVTAILATTSLAAQARTGTQRRSEGKSRQEAAVAEELVRAGFTEVPRREVCNLREAPEKGQFCPECKLGTRKADLLVTSWDGRVVPIECKVSNSAVNSIKRLNNDAGSKAQGKPGSRISGRRR